MSDLEKTGITPIWVKKGQTPEEYSRDLENRLNNLYGIIKSGEGDSSLVKNTIKDTLDFVLWISTETEMQKASQLLKTMLREDQKRHGTSKRNN